MLPSARVVLLGGAGVAPNTAGLFNFKRSSLAKIKLARDNARFNNSNGAVLLIGDSTTVGLDSQGGLSTVNIKNGCYGTQLAQKLSAAGVPAAAQNCFCDFGYGTNAPVNDPRLSAGSWALNSGVQAMAGQTWQATGAGNGTISFTPTIQTDTVDIYYVTDASTGSFNANVNGGTNTPVNTSGASGYGKATISGSLASNTYNVAWASGGSVFIVGFNAYNSATKQLFMLNFGQGGATSTLLLNNLWQGAAALIGVLNPSLSIIQVGINDWINGTAAGTFTSNLQALITAAKTTGDVLLMSPFQSSSGVVAFATQQPFLDNYAPLAVSNNCVLLDTNARWGGFTGGNASGYYATDGIHGEFSAYADEALALSQILLAA